MRKNWFLKQLFFLHVQSIVSCHAEGPGHTETPPRVQHGKRQLTCTCDTRLDATLKISPKTNTGIFSRRRMSVKTNSCSGSNFRCGPGLSFPLL